jgi:murein L,D-transpeptidase YafK
VKKSERRLIAACEGGGELSFPVALSRQPRGAKERAGDERTPEGDYRLLGPPRRSRFHLFLPIDYPSTADAERALRAGRITRQQHGDILEAHARGELPPQDGPLGGQLGLHGEGERWRGDADLDWTLGCVALADEAIDELAAKAPSGTPVRISP